MLSVRLFKPLTVIAAACLAVFIANPASATGVAALGAKLKPITASTDVGVTKVSYYYRHHRRSRIYRRHHRVRAHVYYAPRVHHRRYYRPRVYGYAGYYPRHRIRRHHYVNRHRIRRGHYGGGIYLRHRGLSIRYHRY